MAESHVPLFFQGQTEQWCYSCHFGSQMRSKCPAEEKKSLSAAAVYTRWHWITVIFMLIKVTAKAFPFPFKCKGADERLNMNYMFKEVFNCAFKETEDISADAWAAYLIIVCDVTRFCSLLGILSSGRTSLILTGEKCFGVASLSKSSFVTIGSLERADQHKHTRESTT